MVFILLSGFVMIREEESTRRAGSSTVIPLTIRCLFLWLLSCVARSLTAAVGRSALVRRVGSLFPRAATPHVDYALVTYSIQDITDLLLSFSFVLSAVVFFVRE